ncbi:MAG: tyrosine-type recombinase/integrase [Candidatus Bathyarchaeia archaeon]
MKLKASGLTEGTLRNISYSLAKQDKLCNLTDPEQAKLTIANMNVANSYKQNLIKAYSYFAELNQITWKRPRYKHERQIPKIPTRENIMKVISHAKKYAPIFKTLMETGLMPYELSQVESKDIDFERGTLNARGYKGHASRAFKLTQETTAMLKTYFAKYPSFPNALWIQKMWRQHRNTVSKKLQDPAIRNIRLYDLRHYYATTLHAKTKDILLVKQQLGHKKIETTLIYTQLVAFNEENDYACKTATNVKEATDLIEYGFEYIIEMDGLKLFRKRK